MNITGKHKIYGGVLGAGLLAIVADKTILAPDDVAPATGMPAAPAAEIVAVKAVSFTPMPSENPIGAQLHAIAEARGLDVPQMPDAFSPSGWGVVAPTDDVEVAEFLASHRLTALMAARGGGCAIVDGNRLRVGETLDGFTLRELTDGTAVFLAPDGFRTAELKVRLWE